MADDNLVNDPHFSKERKKNITIYRMYVDVNSIRSQVSWKWIQKYFFMFESIPSTFAKMGKIPLCVHVQLEKSNALERYL